MPKPRPSSFSPQSPSWTGRYKNCLETQKDLQAHLLQIRSLQEMLASEQDRSLMVILHGLDGAGKDSVIKHVFAYFRCNTYDFKTSVFKEKDFAAGWTKMFDEAVPSPGSVSVLNRSYYEVLFSGSVHPEWGCGIPSEEAFVQKCNEIRAYETDLKRRNVTLLRIFLDVSREEQKRRFLLRIKNPRKQWKFTPEDLENRRHWNAYQRTCGEVLKHFPNWHVIPADAKWYAHVATAEMVLAELKRMRLAYPKPGKERKHFLKLSKSELLHE